MSSSKNYLAVATTRGFLSGEKVMDIFSVRVLVSRFKFLVSRHFVAPAIPLLDFATIG